MTKDRTSPEPYREFVRPFHEASDAAHNFNHIERIWARTGQLSAGGPPVRQDVLNFLVFFHGLWGRLCCDSIYEREIRQFLRDLDWADDEIDSAYYSLERHLVAPQSYEEELVHDANYLETLGALGLARAFHQAGGRGQSLESAAELLAGSYPDAILFRTTAGKLVAERERSYMAGFLDRLHADLKGA